MPCPCCPCGFAAVPHHLCLCLCDFGWNATVPFTPVYCFARCRCAHACNIVPSLPSFCVRYCTLMQRTAPYYWLPMPLPCVPYFVRSLFSPLCSSPITFPYYTLHPFCLHTFLLPCCRSTHMRSRLCLVLACHSAACPSTQHTSIPSPLPCRYCRDNTFYMYARGLPRQSRFMRASFTSRAVPHVATAHLWFRSISVATLPHYVPVLPLALHSAYCVSRHYRVTTCPFLCRGATRKIWTCRLAAPLLWLAADALLPYARYAAHFRRCQPAFGSMRVCALPLLRFAAAARFITLAAPSRFAFRARAGCYFTVAFDSLPGENITLVGSSPARCWHCALVITSCRFDCYACQLVWVRGLVHKPDLLTTLCCCAGSTLPFLPARVHFACQH